MPSIKITNKELLSDAKRSADDHRQCYLRKEDICMHVKVSDGLIFDIGH